MIFWWVCVPTSFWNWFGVQTSFRIGLWCKYFFGIGLVRKSVNNLQSQVWGNYGGCFHLLVLTSVAEAAISWETNLQFFLLAVIYHHVKVISQYWFIKVNDFLWKHFHVFSLDAGLKYPVFGPLIWISWYLNMRGEVYKICITRDGQTHRYCK